MLIMMPKWDHFMIILSMYCLDDDPKEGPYFDYLDCVMLILNLNKNHICHYHDYVYSLYDNHKRVP